MNTEKFSEAMGELDDRYVERAIRYQAKKRKHLWVRWGSAAACLCLTLALSLLIASHLDGRLTDEYPTDRQGSSTDSGYPFVSMQTNADWPYYDTAKEAVDASVNVYHGMVTDISFAIIDTRTGLVDHSPSSASDARMLYTVYTISVRENYKGEHPASVRLCVMGGLAGYREEAQYALMEAAGLLPRYPGIVVSNESHATLAIGNEYLFCTCRTAGDFDAMINPIQFAHAIGSENSRKIISACR